MGDGQYTVNSCLLDTLNEIDNRIVNYVQAGEEDWFKADLEDMIGTVRAKGKRLNDTTMIESDIIVPPADLTLAEAMAYFKGDGVIAG